MKRIHKIGLVTIAVLCFHKNDIFGQSHTDNPLQSKKPTTKSNGSKKAIISQSAQFPGGSKALNKFLLDHMKYPPPAREMEIQGKVLLSFLINEKGTVGDIRILREIGGGCGKEAVRVVSDMPPWIPAQYKGNPVKSLVEYPVEFKLQDQ